MIVQEWQSINLQNMMWECFFRRLGIESVVIEYEDAVSANLSEKTGRRQKDAAVARISAHLVRSEVQNYGTPTVPFASSPTNR